jgi:hypothetical protein
MNNDTKLESMFAEFLKIYRYDTHARIVDTLTTELNDDIKKKVYQLSDGNRSTRDIKKLAGITPPTIINYWKQWSQKGIAIPAQRKGRYMAVFNLNDYGLSILDEIEQGDEE